MRERALYAYLALAGVFLGALVLCNLIVLKFFGFTWPSWMPFVGGELAILSVGILPYPLTFLCTDLLSEIYGKKRADAVVWVGLLVSILTLAWIQLAIAVPAKTAEAWVGEWTAVESPDIDVLDRALEREAGARASGLRFAWQTAWSPELTKTDQARGRLLLLDERGTTTQNAALPLRLDAIESAAPMPRGSRQRVNTISPIGDDLFVYVFGGSMRAILASMLAYLFAQWIDIRLFHFWKRVTKGKHLWLRNNASTILSQLVDSTLVITVLFAGVWSNAMIFGAILSAWLFKICCALVDTPLIYAGVALFRRFDLMPSPVDAIEEGGEC